MANPDDSALETELSATVVDLLINDRDSLTVNLVRQKVEEKFGLESGFFKSTEWKARSKQIIEKTNVRYLAVSCPTENSCGPRDGGR